MSEDGWAWNHPEGVGEGRVSLVQASPPFAVSSMHFHPHPSRLPEKRCTIYLLNRLYTLQSRTFPVQMVFKNLTSGKIKCLSFNLSYKNAYCSSVPLLSANWLHFLCPVMSPSGPWTGLGHVKNSSYCLRAAADCNSPPPAGRPSNCVREIL